jgi:hypothetical protein
LAGFNEMLNPGILPTRESGVHLVDWGRPGASLLGWDACCCAAERSSISTVSAAPTC